MSEVSSERMAAKRRQLGQQEMVSKRRRQEEALAEQLLPTSLTKSNSNATFHPVHLDVLRALYDDSKSNHNREISEEDGVVEPEFWGTVDRYLQHRPQLRANADITNATKALSEEAQIIIRANQENPPLVALENPYPSRDCMPLAAGSNSGVLSSSSQKSPHSPRFSSSQQRATGAGGFSSQLTQNLNTNNNHEQQGLSIVHMLLDRQYRTSLKKLRQQTEPVRPIQAAAAQRVQRLEQLVQRSLEQQHHVTQSAIQAMMMDPSSLSSQKSQQQTTSSSTKPKLTSSNETSSEEDVLLRLTMKLRLWKLLLQDLQANTK